MTWERQRVYDFDAGKEAGIQQKAIETAKNYLSMGLSPEQVSKGSDLPLETVFTLQKELQLTPVP